MKKFAIFYYRNSFENWNISEDEIAKDDFTKYSPCF